MATTARIFTRKSFGFDLLVEQTEGKWQGWIDNKRISAGQFDDDETAKRETCRVARSHAKLSELPDDAVDFCDSSDSWHAGRDVKP